MKMKKNQDLNFNGYSVGCNSQRKGKELICHFYDKISKKKIREKIVDVDAERVDVIISKRGVTLNAPADKSLDITMSKQGKSKYLGVSSIEDDSEGEWV